MKKEKKKAQRYRHVEGKGWIEVRVKDPHQLFDMRDPAPFRERDLDDDFADYITSSAQEFSHSTPLKVILYIESKESKELSKEAIKEAIHSFFLYQIERQTLALKRYVKQLQFFLLIGIFILTSSIAIARSLSAADQTGALGGLREGIIIFGWVSLWKPIELLLFDWYPLFETLRLYKKLSATEFEIQFSAF